MRESLQQLCERQVANEAILKKVKLLDEEKLIKLGGLLYLDKGITPDRDYIKSCKKILKQKTGILSNFRGALEYIVFVKMSLADDPSTYLDEALGVYEQLKKGHIFPGESIAMTAMTIADQCPPERYDEVVAKTQEAYASLRELHPFLTDQYDMALIALMCIAGLDSEEESAQVEELYQALRNSRVPGEAAQSAAMVLSLSPKPIETKADGFIELYQALKSAKCATPRDSSMAIYATYADIEQPLDQIVNDISEVEAWLKKQKGYGVMGAGKIVRRVIAAALVLEDYRSKLVTPTAVTVVAEAVTEEIVLIIMMLIIASTISSASSSSH